METENPHYYQHPEGQPPCECGYPQIWSSHPDECRSCGRLIAKPKDVAASPVSACAGWRDKRYFLPEDGEWVLHTYYGVRPPDYGLFKNGRFWRHDGPESFPTTHWLRIPSIDGHNAQAVKVASRVRHWSVTVAVDGMDVVEIQSKSLSGLENVTDFRPEIIEAAENLLAFIGTGQEVFEFDDMPNEKVRHGGPGNSK